MRRLVRGLLRRMLGGLNGLLWRNPFVYSRSLEARVPGPDIPVRPVELYGQCGEDLILAALLRARSLEEGVDLAGERYLEVGGNHPFATSPTYLLQRQLGMTGVIVEANPELIGRLETGRPRDSIVHAAVQTNDVTTATLNISKLSELSTLDEHWLDAWSAVRGKGGAAGQVTVPATRMNRILEQHFADRSPLFLSIDVETLDLELLQDVDFSRWRPWLVQAEPSEQYHPGETTRMIDHMRTHGYSLVARTEVNLIFADTSA